MGEINWGLGIMPDIGTNALAAFERGQQQGQQRRTRNALAAYATSPNEQTLAPLMQADPMLGMKFQQQQQEQAATQREQQRADLPTMGKLLRYGMQGPQQWAQARAQAQQMGIDVSQVPEQLDPQWAQQQVGMIDAMSSGKLDIPALAQEVMLSLPPDQRDVNHPAFVQAMQGAMAKTMALEPGGSVARYNPMTGQTEMVVLANPGGVVPGTPVQGGAPANLPHITSPDEAKRLPPGSQFIMPDGRVGTVPGGPTPQASGGFLGQ